MLDTIKVNQEDLKLISKKLADRYKDDVCVQYLNRRMQRSKDWVEWTSAFSTLNSHIKETYGFEIV